MALLGELTYALIAGDGRSIGGIIPDVTIEEGHRDALIITQHPVEKGAAITDHAFAQPPEVTIRCGFSNSSAGDPGYARAIYDAFVAWKTSRQPRDVFTGKRAYRQMLPAEIGVITEARTENVLALTVRCQNIIITSTQTTGTDSDTTAAGSGQDNQGSPQTTASVADGGQQQATGVSDTSFAGSFSPGYAPNVTGTGAGLDAGPALDGISPSTQLQSTPTIPDASGVDPSTSNLMPNGTGGGVTPYNPFVM